MHQKNFFVFTWLLIAALACSAAIRPAYAEVNDDYALKISLENQLERKLKQVIVEITGTDKVVIFVNAELVSKGGGDRGRIEKKADALVLPGVPAKKEFGTGQTAELMLPGAGKYSVNKIVLSIWIDKSVPQSIVELIQDIAKNVISYNQGRGDQINVKRVDFEAKGFLSSIFSIPNFYWLILTAVGGFMMTMLGLFFMDPLKKIVPSLKEIDWSMIRGASSAGAATVERTTTFEREIISDRRSEATQAVTGEKESALPFSFIRERDIPAVAYLLRDKSPQDIAVVVNYLDPALATRLLDSFPKEKQVEVSLLLGQEQISPERVLSTEEFLKNKLAYVVGGESKLVSLLDMASEDVRDKIVKTLEAQNAAAAARIKQRIKSLETILSELPAQGIQTLLRNVDLTLFSQVLRSMPDSIRQKVTSSLSAGIAERIKQEMDLSRPLSSARLKRERQNLMATVRRLINEGIVEVENN